MKSECAKGRIREGVIVCIALDAQCGVSPQDRCCRFENRGSVA